MADLAVRGTILLVAGWIVLAAARRGNPRVCVLVSRALVLSLLALPVCWTSLPRLDLPILPALRQQGRTNVVHGNARATTSPADARVGQTPAHVGRGVRNPDADSIDAAGEGAISAAPPQAAVSAADAHADAPASRVIRPVESHRVAPRGASAIVIVWAGVALVLATRLAAQVIRTRRLIAASLESSPLIHNETAAVGALLGIAGQARVKVAGRIAGPCTAGWLHPVVLLPAAWLEPKTSQERQTLIAHELAHVAGRDPLWDLIARLATCGWWFHPLAWRLPTVHRLACEHVCDAAASHVAGGFESYRKKLAAWALELRTANGALITLAMADRTLLSRRLSWLTRAHPTAPLTRRRWTSLSVAAGAFCVATAALQPAPYAAGVNEGAIADVQSQVVDSSAHELDSAAADGDAESPRDERSTTLRVLNAEGQAVVGAQIRVVWNFDRDGTSAIAQTDHVTDAKGSVVLRHAYPTDGVHIVAEAEGYARYDGFVSLTGAPEILLARGRIIKVRAVDDQGAPLSDAIPLLEDSRIWGRGEFQPRGDGVFVSPVVDPMRKLMRVVYGSRGGPLFSDLIDVTAVGLADADGVVTAALRPGARLEGRLDDAVPRPIEHGCVNLYIREAMGHKIIAGANRWEWRQTAAIERDGTFVFDSLPPGGHAQLFALVDGFQSSSPTADEMRAYFTEHDAGPPAYIDEISERRNAFWPQVVPLDQDVVRVQLACSPTASVDVTVVDPEGRPIEGADVSFSPNGAFMGGHLFIPCLELSHASLFGGSPWPWANLPEQAWASQSFLRVKSDDKGVARVRNLPGAGTESFHVRAVGFVMPIHPTWDGAEGQGSEWRYAVVDRTPGKIVSHTVTLERDVPHVERALMVIDAEGQPVAGVSLTAVEISFDGDADAWQSWAVQRFGPIASGKSGENGRVVLRLPSKVSGRDVKGFRISVDGGLGPQSWGRSTVTIPLVDDGSAVVLRFADERPRVAGRLPEVVAAYVNPDSVLGARPAVVLKKLLEQPSLALLQQLFALNKFDEARPLEFAPDGNSLRISDEPKPAVVQLPTSAGNRVIALCKVRPKDADWQSKPPDRFPPEAAFVFEAVSGKLLAMIGGGAAATGDYENIMLTDLGGAGDYFVGTAAFESHGSFQYLTRWHWLGGLELGPALTVRHYANSGSWSPASGNGVPIAEFGHLGFEFNGENIAHEMPGITTGNVRVPRRIVWDVARDGFFGAAAQTFDGRPLYQVVVEKSSRFTPVEPTPQEIVVSGGRRDFYNWHWWLVVTPPGPAAIARLTLIDETGAPTVLAEHELAGGKQHNLQLQVDPAKQTGAKSTVLIRVNGGGAQQEIYDVPPMPIDDRPSVAGQPAMFAASGSVRLFDKPLEDASQSLTWRIELVD